MSSTKKYAMVGLSVGTLALVASPALGDSSNVADGSSGSTAGALTVIGSPGDLAVGAFHHNLTGISQFTTAGSNLRVYGAYSRLMPNRAYFTVIYGNAICDPAQAFPVGPFFTDGRGRATLAAAVALPGTVDVGGTGSVSVRRGDNATDIDNDGKIGPTDVVAVAGHPSIGLIECDSNPTVLNLS